MTATTRIALGDQLVDVATHPLVELVVGRALGRLSRLGPLGIEVRLRKHARRGIDDVTGGHVDALVDYIDELAVTVPTDRDPLGINEVAELLNVKRQTVDQWRHRGVIPAPDYTISGHPAWRYATIHAWARITRRFAGAAIRRTLTEEAGR